MPIELTKAQKKVARALIDKGLQTEYQIAITKLRSIIEIWKQGKADNRKTYMDLYRSLTLSDKNIASRYNFLSGSNYIQVICGLLADGIIKENELDPLGDELKNQIISISRIFNE